MKEWSYDPNKNPAIIDINFERALHWIGVGAQPTDTVRAMLSYKGVLYKNHLLKGVKKGALTEAQVEERFNAWLVEKENKIESKISNLEKAQEKAKSDALVVEKAKNESRAKAIAEAEAAALVAATEEAPAKRRSTTEDNLKKHLQQRRRSTLQQPKKYLLKLKKHLQQLKIRLLQLKKRLHN